MRPAHQAREVNQSDRGGRVEDEASMRPAHQAREVQAVHVAAKRLERLQ